MLAITKPLLRPGAGLVGSKLSKLQSIFLLPGEPCRLVTSRDWFGVDTVYSWELVSWSLNIMKLFPCMETFRLHPYHFWTEFSHGKSQCHWRSAGRRTSIMNHVLLIKQVVKIPQEVVKTCANGGSRYELTPLKRYRNHHGRRMIFPIASWWYTHYLLITSLTSRVKIPTAGSPCCSFEYVCLYI